MHATNANIDNKTLIVTSKVDNLNWWKNDKDNSETLLPSNMIIQL